MANTIVEFGKRIAFRHLGLGIPRYDYNIEPIQLATLVMELERLRNTRGAIVEIGVSRGLTTRFLVEHILKQGLNERLYAIDTFASFVDSDLEYEVNVRGKRMREVRGFEFNDYAVWKRNFADFPFVVPLQADCSTFDYASVAPIKLVFLDVDLYLPTKNALPKIYEQLCDGGVILIDDVRDRQAWDGPYQAYVEFCAQRQLPPVILGNKCGVIRK
jgi:hypothetical protein